MCRLLLLLFSPGCLICQTKSFWHFLYLNKIYRAAQSFLNYFLSCNQMRQQSFFNSKFNISTFFVGRVFFFLFGIFRAKNHTEHTRIDTLHWTVDFIQYLLCFLFSLFFLMIKMFTEYNQFELFSFASTNVKRWVMLTIFLNNKPLSNMAMAMAAKVCVCVCVSMCMNVPVWQKPIAFANTTQSLRYRINGIKLAGINSWVLFLATKKERERESVSSSPSLLLSLRMKWDWRERVK